VSVDSRPGRSPEVRDRCTDRLPIDGENLRIDLGFTGESWDCSANVSDDRRDLRNVREDLGCTGKCREWLGEHGAALSGSGEVRETGKTYGESVRIRNLVTIGVGGGRLRSEPHASLPPAGDLVGGGRAAGKLGTFASHSEADRHTRWMAGECGDAAGSRRTRGVRVVFPSG